MYPTDDTMLKNEQTQFTNNSNESGTQEGGKKTGSNAAKIAAGVAASVGLGVGSAYAANEYFQGKDAEEAAETEKATDNTSAATPKQETENVAKTEEATDDESVNTISAPTAHNEVEVDVKISGIETVTDDEGNVRHVATGTVDGHQAQFVDDGEGNVVAAAVDANDNGQVDEGEVIDMRDSGMGMNDLAQHLTNEAPEQTVQPQYTSNEAPEVEVIGVEENVVVDGDVVDVAVVSINEEPVLFVDETQNGTVDLVIADDNGNGSIEETEIHDVSDSGIPMPTADDVSADYASVDPGMPDYSNDSDITMYEV